MSFLKIVFDICLLRGRVQDLPASMGLVWVVVTASVVMNALGVSERALDFQHLLTIISQVMFFGAVVWLLLRSRNVTARWMQTVTALYAVDAVLVGLMLPFFPALTEMMNDMMEAVKQGQQEPEIKPVWEVYVLFGLFLWKLLVTARVLREAAGWSLPIAFLIGFAALVFSSILGALVVLPFGRMAPP